MCRAISINSASALTDATSLDNSAMAFTLRNLQSIDDRSTISANSNGKNAYADSQSAFRLFGDTLAQDANNIRSINIEYEEYDSMLARMISMTTENKM